MMGMREKCVFCYLGVLSAALTLSTVWAGRRMTDDASDVTWAHAVNSKQDLNEAVLGPVSFLEADILMGTLSNSSDPKRIPIMAHPPAYESDISLNDWLKMATQYPQKNLKLDFKSNEVLLPALEILRKWKNKIRSSLWLNADILKATDDPTFSKPLDPEFFINATTEDFPEATISVGWTTAWTQKGRYQWPQVFEMAKYLRCRKRQKNHITFPVRATYIHRSLAELKWLLDVIPDSSLTVWASPIDYLNATDLLKLRSELPFSKVYYDLPENNETAEFLRKKGEVIYQPFQVFTKDNWKLFDPTGETDRCEGKPYVGSAAVMFVNDTPQVLQLKDKFELKGKFEITGRVRFFYPNGEKVPSSPFATLAVVVGSPVVNDSVEVKPSTALDEIWDNRVSKSGNVFSVVFERAPWRISNCIKFAQVESFASDVIASSMVEDCTDEDSDGFVVRPRSLQINEFNSPLSIAIRYSSNKMAAVLYDLNVIGQKSHVTSSASSFHRLQLVPSFVCVFIGVLAAYVFVR